MHLPFLKKSPQPIQREYLYALEINHHQVKSAIWTIVNRKPQVVGTGPTVEWDDTNTDSLVSACDQSISECTDKFDPTGKISPEKVILGLPSDWLASEKIAGGKLHMLKGVFQKLELEAVGFVVVADAAVRYLQVTESAQPTAILIGVSAYNLEVTVAKMGKIVGTEIVRRSNQAAADVTEGLSRFVNVEMLPSRILLYDTDTPLEELRQELLAHPWQAPQTRLPFLHFPKIEVLPRDFSIRAIALAGGSEVAQAIGLVDSPPQTPTEPEPAFVPDGAPTEEPEFTPPTRPEPPPKIPEVTSPQDLGFVLSSGSAEVGEYASDSEFGYAPAHGYTARADQDYAPSSPSPRSAPRVRKLTFPFRGEGSRKGLLFGLVAALLVFLAAGFALVWLVPTATVTLTQATQQLDADFDLTANTTLSAVDAAIPAIPATLQEVTVTKTETTAATGSKLIGDKATGTVTIINGTSVTKTFPSGTILTSPAGLKFVTTADVTIASASGSADPNSYQPGKATVKVSASQIGTDSNLTAGTQLKVGSFSSLDYIAKNDEAFSGGSSRQVKAVAKDDLAKLRAAVTQSAKDEAKQQLVAKAGSDQTMVDQSIQLSSPTEEFNHKVDEQADEVSLKLTVKATGYVVSTADVKAVVTQVLTPKVPQGYKLAGDATQNFSVKTADKTKAVLTVKSSATVVPQMDTDEIRRNLVGKSKTVARQYVESLPGISAAEIKYSLPLPGFLLSMPHSENRISVVVVSN